MKIFRRLGIFYKNRYRASSMRSFIDVWWYGMLRLALVLALAGILFGAWILYEALRGVSPSGESAVSNDTLKRAELKDVLLDLELGRVEYEALRSAPPSLVDPSR